MKRFFLFALSVTTLGFFLAQPLSAEESKSVSIAAPPPQTEASSKSESMTKRVQSGFSNIVFGPLEPIYQLREEVKKTDPVRGFIPGLFKGVGWGLAREFVGVYELLTFHQPHKQTLKEFDTEWVYA